MKISIKGPNPKISKKELRFATEYMTGLLLSKRMMKNLYVEVYSHPNMAKDCGHEKFADCVWLDEDTRPREFKIRLNAKKSKRVQLLSLAHELVHVKQMALNEMRSVFKRRPEHTIHHVKWKTDFVHAKETHYFDLPWEIEAHGREYGMYARYMEHKAANKIKFTNP